MQNFYNVKFNININEFMKIQFPKNIAPCKIENCMIRNYTDPDTALSEIKSDTTNELVSYEI